MPLAPPSPFVRNRVVDTVIRKHSEPQRIEVCSHSLTRGFIKTSIIQGEDTGFEVATALLNGNESILPQLSPDEAMALWRAGLIVLPDERTPPFAPESFSTPRDFYAANGYTLINNCIFPAMTASLISHYRAKLEAGALLRGDVQVDRYTAHNDPAGRVVQQALRPAVEHIVGAPIKASYTYTSLYCGGTDLPIHTDRSQCQYTVSLLIDYQPIPSDGISPWPIRVYPNANDPMDCHQRLGGGILFRGCEIRHGRPSLPANDTCWVMLLHYVDADFSGSLD
ncbi:hypothetical protein [Methylomonas fluvii]|uniref:Fe2OG dioxygenase domain-containing protein n=1 Tax=Methylomonas fluvii TaxID=1854564 RepID=A0ABR9DH50_9GAMM|nr:hypothetical protein [Methylomonas fluvii]MBD9362429.1 hypothetical protein [Methylomonas fluvii]CAD6875529.1 hypothetical protein [Methylomonas fluvii]